MMLRVQFIDDEVIHSSELTSSNLQEDIIDVGHANGNPFYKKLSKEDCHKVLMYLYNGLESVLDDIIVDDIKDILEESDETRCVTFY